MRPTPIPVTLHVCERGHSRLFAAGVWVEEPVCHFRNCRAPMQEPVTYASQMDGLRAKRLLGGRPKPANAENTRGAESPARDRVALIPAEDSHFIGWERQHEADMSRRLENLWSG